MEIAEHYKKDNIATIFIGDRLEFLKEIPDKEVQLIFTSPPYNIGKSYEKNLSIDDYLKLQEETLTESYRVLSDTGSLCWQVGNHITKDKEVIPLDLLLYPICKKLGLILKNRIVWHFEHGLHCTHRFSGRYETILWFVKSDNYTFNVDPVRIPQKYPGKKHFKGKNIGKLSCNPLGKNPGDVWIIPNVKNNHVEKTIHPCQFPIELVERFVLSTTNKDDLVIDPYCGSGSTLCAAIKNNRRTAGSDIVSLYTEITKKRIIEAHEGTLASRSINTKIYNPNKR